MNFNRHFSAIGHFTVMTGEANTHLGCAAITFTQDGWNKFFMACNYATTNIVNYRLYTSGAAASGCKSGKSATYPSLCAKGETYVYPS